jgi:DNA repair exonuclease SbcCD ATPase subunit
MNLSLKFTVVVAVVLLAGCNAREKELEQQNVLLLSESDSLRGVIAERNRFFDEIVASINDVYVGLEAVRKGEEQIRMQAEGDEATMSVTSSASREHLLEQVKAIDTALEDNKAKISGLESRIKSLQRDHKGLNEMLTNVKAELALREERIAALETNIKNLEDDNTHKSMMLVERDSVIHNREEELNTVYYIAGTRSELEEMGILADEGGFLWGLLGSTPVVASGVNESLFNRLDVRDEWVITIDGEIEELVPKRNQEYYISTPSGEDRSNLEILDGERFWQERYLVIITG